MQCIQRLCFLLNLFKVCAKKCCVCKYGDSFSKDAKNSNPCFNEKSVSGKIIEWLHKNKLKSPVVPLLANKSAIFPISVFI